MQARFAGRKWDVRFKRLFHGPGQGRNQHGAGRRMSVSGIQRNDDHRPRGFVAAGDRPAVAERLALARGGGFGALVLVTSVWEWVLFFRLREILAVQSAQ